MKKIVYLFTILASSLILAEREKTWQSSPYFSTKVLKKYDHVCTKLKKEKGFVEGFFTTQDKLAINYIYLERPNAQFTFIGCSGFWPGRKEGLATFYALLPENCNILLFDARGHGKSHGHLFRTIWWYGQHEYKDIIAAIRFAHQRNKNLPIIIYGICAGAFHAAHALINLQQQNLLETCNVKGFIFDSGWGSLTQVAKTAPPAEIEKILAKKITYSKKNVLLTCLAPCVRASTQIVYRAFFWPFFALQEKKITLLDKINTIGIPIFYIHGKDDDYAPINEVKKLARATKHKICWWLTPPSKHACNHLKYKQAYRKHLHYFIKSIVS